MAGISNNLYPPIVDTSMPSFERTTPCTVYFSLSSYNDSEDILTKYVQVTITNQNNSLTALDPEYWPAGVMFATLRSPDPSEENFYEANYYSIRIPPAYLKNKAFEINQYYKVQIRFTSSSLPETSQISVNPGFGSYQCELTAKWLTECQSYFSEWSTVCLVKGIVKPLFYFKGFEDEDSTLVSSSVDEVLSLSEVVDLVGGIEFNYGNNDTEEESEYLDSYEVNIYDSEESLCYESGIQYTNEYYPNEINYKIKTNLEDGSIYTLKVDGTTNNGYELTTYEKTFRVFTSGVDETLNATVSAEEDQDNGRIIITITSTDSVEFLGNLCIRRSSSETNFTIWEDVFIEAIADGEPLDFTWYDYTVESGIWYKYCAQKITPKGLRGTVVYARYPVMIYLDDIFLTREGMQIKIKYDPAISSFKHTYIESKTETIGSKYPYIRRNGNVAYRQFPISGLITAFMDEEGIFINKESTFGDSLEYYEEYNDENIITEYNDFAYERKFREQIMDFLYADKATLFRSLPEGNILVRLMDVSFTPNQTLGRMLYSFSATAYEIDECSLDNFDKYGIQSVGTYSDYIEYLYEYKGQIAGTYSSSDKSNFSDIIISSLQNDLESSTVSNYTQELYYLKWLRIEFQSDPYLIVCGSDGSLTPASQLSNFTVTNNTVYGYIVYINNEPILVSQRGFYELIDDDTEVTSVWFPIETEVIIDYIAYITEYLDSSTYASKFYYYTRAGQLWGSFDSDQTSSLFKQIYAKYYIKNNTYYQKITAIDKITVEASPGTIVYVKDSFDDGYYRHVVGSTGILDFYDDEATIAAFYFFGVHLSPMKDESRLEPEDTEYRDTGITVSSLDEIENPVKNGVYTVTATSSSDETVSSTDETSALTDTVDDENSEEYSALVTSLTEDSEQYIWYNDQWYTITSDGDVLCPVDALVDYVYELIKGVY